MRKVIFALFVLLIGGCTTSDERVASLDHLDFGDAKWYSKFLWVEKDTSVLEKKIKINFNEYAKREQVYVTLVIVDGNQELFCGEHKQVDLFIDDVFCENGKVVIRPETVPDDGILTLGLKFHPNAETGKHSGFISVENHNLDRVGNFDISQDVRVLKWEATYSKIMNPLLLVVLSVLALVLLFLILWFLIFKKVQFPSVKTPKIELTQPYFSSLKVKGARQVVFSNKACKQGFLDRLFKGTIVYSKNDCWTQEVHVFPGRKKGQLRIKLPSGYQIKSSTDKKPVSFLLERFQGYDIINEKKEVIQIKIY